MGWLCGGAWMIRATSSAVGLNTSLELDHLDWASKLAGERLRKLDGLRERFFFVGSYS